MDSTGVGLRSPESVVDVPPTQRGIGTDLKKVWRTLCGESKRCAEIEAVGASRETAGSGSFTVGGGTET